MSLLHQSNLAISKQGRNSGKKVIKGPIFSIPDNLLKEFTMNGFVRVKFDWYYSDTSGEVLNWTNIFYNDLKKTVSSAIKEKGNIYYSTDHLIPEMFQKYPINSKSVAVIGSATPLYEAYVDYFGGKPLTIEYRRIEHNLPHLQTYTFHDAVKKINNGQLKTDHAFCYSSIEHSGLGRYGDYLDPEGDLLTMRMIKKMVKPGGLLFLQIPVGRDLLLWNGTRIYGPHRLLLLLEGWKLLDSFCYNSKLLSQLNSNPTESIFVLENTKQGNSQQQLFTNSIIENFQSLEDNRSVWHKKVKQLSSGFSYHKSTNNSRIGYDPPSKWSFKKILRRVVSFLLN